MSPSEAINQFNVELLCQLPLESDIFFAMAKRADLFPLDTGDSIAAQPTRAKKVSYFLQHVVEPGAEQYLPKLLKVMKESKVANVVKLADDIQAATGIVMYVHMCMCIAMYISYLAQDLHIIIVPSKFKGVLICKYLHQFYLTIIVQSLARIIWLIKKSHPFRWIR